MTQLRDNWVTSQRQLEHNWKTSGRRGDKWETTCGRQLGVVGDKLKTTSRQLGYHIRRVLGENIWETLFGRQVETSARQLRDGVPGFQGSRDPALCMGKGEEVKIPPSAPRDWNKMKSKLGDRQSWETRWKMKCSGRHSGRHKDTVTVGDKLGDTAGDK